jgi:hypothetical protein
MRGINPAAVYWLLAHAAREHWAEFFFPLKSLWSYYFNITESLNDWLLGAKEKPVIAMLEHIRHQLME